MPSRVVDHLLFLNEQSPVSGRHAVLAAEDDSLWLYLTKESSPTPERDCWVLNLPSAPPDPDLELYQKAIAPPPAPAAMIEARGVRALSKADRWSFRWSEDGHAAAAVLNGFPVAFVVAGRKRGFSRYLRAKCDWGNAWDETLFARLFPKAA